ncbi:hypothetical protein HF203_11820 [Marichromatium bheemlicum]|uniref:Uncharacterized protein n=1 Tax=Marichromatium bheemlicum TaxID=365339 RepID=A0ABX1I8M8_9GAMM|nr:hypothetical protein [Marichromatium bheemlicum]
MQGAESRVDFGGDRLVLTPTDPHARPGVRLLISQLTQCGFIGAPTRRGGGVYQVGDAFLSLVSFIGCAVRIDATGQGQGPWCRVGISRPSSRTRPCLGRNTRAPRCHSCRERLEDWARRLELWHDQPRSGWRCVGCGVVRPPWSWDWGRGGGFGRSFVEITGVFPGEAVPTPALLDLLTRASGLNWRYFYVQG